ncbi:MAG: flagellar biosynthetic protein FliO [Lacisediminihabitans sp.]
METFLAGLRVVVSLAVVVALLWVLQRRLTRGSRASGAAKPVRIVTKQAISPKASVVIIDVEGTRLLLGVTEHAVSVLQTSDIPLEVEASVESSSATAFAATMSSVKTAKPATKAVTTTSTTTKIPAQATRKPAAKPAQKSPELAPVAAFTGATQAGGMLAGSILSPATWRQLVSVFRQGR